MCAKLKVILCAIIVLIMFVIIVRIYLQQEKVETAEQDDKIVMETTIEIKNNKIEIETDKEGETEESVALIETVETEKIEDIEIEIIDDVETTEITDTETIIETESKHPTEIEPLFYLSDYERKVAECIVMGESGSESYEGQTLVAFCILNACLKDGLQPSEVRTKYKYSGWHDNPHDNVKKAVSAVFNDGYKPVDDIPLYFYAPKYSKGQWHETQRFVIEVGGHRFFAEWND